MKKGQGFFLLGLLFLWINGQALAERIVVLYAAASPVLKALGVREEVVGTTRNDPYFPRAIKVGSHLRPNVELIKALKPTFIIAGSPRTFPPRLKKEFEGQVFFYDPRTLSQILEKIETLGKRLGREEEAEKLVRNLKSKLQEIHPLPCRPKVIFEVMERPLRVAGQRNIITDIIQVAGGLNPVNVPRKHVLISPEKILFLSPDLYLYQVGPMNKNPLPPSKRAYFSGLKAKVIRVKEFEFSRPGPNAFEATLKLNRILKNFCLQRDQGRAINSTAGPKANN